MSIASTKTAASRMLVLVLRWTTVLTDVNGTAKVTAIVPADQPKGALVVTATGTGPLTASANLTIK